MAEIRNKKSDVFFEKKELKNFHADILVKLKARIFRAYNLFFKCDDDEKTITVGELENELEDCLDLLKIVAANKHEENLDDFEKDLLKDRTYKKALAG